MFLKVTRGFKSASTWLRRGDRGSMGVMIAAVVIPALIGFGTLTIGNGYYAYRNLLLKQTVQAAGLAAGNKLGTYYSTGTSTAIVAAAQSFAAANMPTAQYGTIVGSSNVTLGNWNSATSSFTSLASSGGTTPNAVQVTGNNTVPLFLGNWFGKPSANATSTVIATYGNGKAFNVIVVNDMSESFTTELANQKAADTAILNCVIGVTGSTSQFGMTLMNGHATTYQALELASTSTLPAKITALTASSCGSNCSTGSNVASGLYSAVQQFSGSTFTGTNKNIIVITDGVPNAKQGETYAPTDGVTCTTNCTDALLLSGAQTQAAAAKTAGISISTIYYSGDTDSQDQASYAASLATLVTGTGIAMVAPTAAAISAAYSGVCSTIPSSLKSVM